MIICLRALKMVYLKIISYEGIMKQFQNMKTYQRQLSKIILGVTK
jgi:hypothetical protein